MGGEGGEAAPPPSAAGHISLPSLPKFRKPGEALSRNPFTETHLLPTCHTHTLLPPFLTPSIEICYFDLRFVLFWSSPTHAFFPDATDPQASQHATRTSISFSHMPHYYYYYYCATHTFPLFPYNLTHADYGDLLLLFFPVSADATLVPCPEIAEGWFKFSKRRIKSASKGEVHFDHIFISPDGAKFNSMVKARRYVTEGPSAPEAWAQCERCEKWRRLSRPLVGDAADAPWFCEYNEDTRHDSCDAPEEVVLIL